ncbi:MAG: adenylyltransferase/cytidyltransferase family protein [Cyanobacteria bacterium P01_G01_bin.54]
MPQPYSLIELQQCITQAPVTWRPLVFTNGCFDLLHVGHVRYLQAARALGQRLVVGLNSDRSVAQLKPQALGYPTRPLIPSGQRAELLLALTAVDAVVVFEERTATPLLEALKPDIYAKGGDYSPETLPEYATVAAYGGRVEFIKIEIPTSTSGLIEKILQAGRGTI